MDGNGTNLVPTRHSGPRNAQLAIPDQLGQRANQAAAVGVFADYRTRKAPQTLRRHAADLALFAAFLRQAGAEPGDLAEQPGSWQGITWGLAKAFVAWMLQAGYAVSTVNERLSTVKVYARLAMQAGALRPEEYAQIKALAGYRQAEGVHMDEQRELAGLPTRAGHKKAANVSITRAQAEQLKDQPDTPQGRRDALLVCLLLDHGLRCGELAGLRVDNLDLERGQLVFYRPKVHKTQTHNLTPASLRVVRAYFDAGDVPAMGPLLRGSRKGGHLTGAGMSVQSITERVRVLGAAVGLAGLSAHDCRHYWATTAARNKTPVDRLQDAGGWTSPAMPLRYVAAAKVANEGVRLDSE